MPVVTYEINNNVGVIRINNPPVNALSHALRAAIQDAVNAAQTDESKALLLICDGRTFIAGADITEFGKPPKDPWLPELLDTIEQSKKIVVAAIHGTALGGGLETALASHYRCAVPTARIGLPEVKLGLLPGAGGTQRLPRLAGAKAALDVMTSGVPISAGKGAELGVIDRIINGDLEEGALAYAAELVASGAKPRRVSELEVDPASATADMFDEYRKRIGNRARGQIAPQNIIKCVEAAAELSFEEGSKIERQLFEACMYSPQSAAMRHLFFAERQAAKVNDVPRDTPLRPIQAVGIIGGGTMGGGIAMNFANVGVPVVMLEINDEALSRGLGIVKKNYDMTMKKGKLTEQQVEQCLALITGTSNYDDLSEVDLVIEAVFENLDIKKEVFTKLDSVCKKGAILATNTSYQDVNQIADATGRPQDVIGLHFFSPANVMKLLEIVRADKTADDVIATCMKMAKSIRKVPVLSGVCYGFIGNRMLGKYFREAQLCLLEGSSPEQVDSVMQSWGMAMGPMAVGDLAGLDIGYKARQGLSDEQKGDARIWAVADALVEMDRLGQKSGAGYYRYDAATRARTSDPVVMKLVEATAAEFGITRRRIGDEEILNRLIFALVNEGAKILEEGIAQRSSDIDVVYVYGYGFPVARGGPMHFADAVGLPEVYETICSYRDQLGADYWEPSPLLEKLAKAGGSFTKWSPG
jgi:3-hydroxyacyl-CoA dehydrogenase